MAPKRQPKLIERYQKEYVARNNKASGAQQKAVWLRPWIRTLGDRPANAITEEDVLAFKNDYLKDRENGRVHADHLIGVMRHMYAWAKQRKLVTSNPAADIARESKYEPRERCLSHNEIKKFWAACDEIGWPSGPIFQLLLLTGQREREIGEMEWLELGDLDKRTLNIPGKRTKNRKAHTVHLSDLAMEIIQGLPRINHSPHVFTMNGNGPFKGYNYAKKRIQRIMGGCTAWQIRDLRRTATTLMAEIGVAPHVADKVLNHTGGQIRGVADVYNRFEYLDERKAALDKLSEFIAMLIGRDPNSVVPLRRQTA